MGHAMPDLICNTRSEPRFCHHNHQGSAPAAGQVRDAGFGPVRLRVGSTGIRSHQLKKLYVAKHPADAHLLKGLLEQQGIPSVIRGEGLFGVRGGTPLTPDTLPSVWVADEDYERARVLAADYDRGAQAVARPVSTWICANCGELSEEQFSECWKCGWSR
jgi:hypothetical protein